MKSLKFFGLGLATTLPTGAWRLVLLLGTAVSLIGYPKPASAATFNVTVGVDLHPVGFMLLSGGGPGNSDQCDPNTNSSSTIDQNNQHLDPCLCSNGPERNDWRFHCSRHWAKESDHSCHWP